MNEDTADRLLTGGDFDIESFRVGRRGDLWFGDEFGPFLVQTDLTERVLEALIPLPDVKSPDYPADFPAPFEGMALSKDGRKPYPTLEGPVTGDDPATRRMYEFDLHAHRYTDRRRTYRVADPSFLVSDLTALDERRLVSFERDNLQGAAAVHKQGFVVDLRNTAADGTLAKHPVVNLLDLADPALISLPGRPGDIGLGDPFSMPYVTIEAVLPLGGGRLAIVNDTNFGSTGRNPSLPDYSSWSSSRSGSRRARATACRPQSDGGCTPSGSGAWGSTSSSTRPGSPRGIQAVIAATPPGRTTRTSSLAARAGATAAS